jgi:predicted acylesterase/phospholipase RssA
LTERDDLPVVIATRMSLSFPVLISAIPMYAVKPSAYAGKKETDTLSAADLQKQWFSDGGVCSNFPIGLFDSWMPKWPTFGINLNYLKSGQKKDGTVPADHVPATSDPGKATLPDVYLPKVGERMRPQWNAIEQFPSFLGSIFTTAQNYRDTLQSILPSYSERIAQVWLDPDEGGMNLTMEVTKIESLAAKGTTAGELLADMNFDAHRCIRLRVLMKVLCKEIEDLRIGYPEVASFQSVATTPDTWCAKDSDWWPRIQPHIQALVTFADTLANAKPCASEVFNKNSPTFEGDLHIHPKI